MQERHLEPKAAKTRTEEKKAAELGDGEPSPEQTTALETLRDHLTPEDYALAGS